MCLILFHKKCIEIVYALPTSINFNTLTRHLYCAHDGKVVGEVVPPCRRQRCRYRCTLQSPANSHVNLLANLTTASIFIAKSYERPTTTPGIAIAASTNNPTPRQDKRHQLKPSLLRRSWQRPLLQSGRRSAEAAAL